MSLKQKIHACLVDHFQPESLEIIDKSDAHRHHVDHAGGDETHLSIKMTSKAFVGKTKVQMHRDVQEVLKSFWETTPLHALELTLFASKED